MSVCVREIERASRSVLLYVATRHSIRMSTDYGDIERGGGGTSRSVCGHTLGEEL